jgi:hypothetical protein
MAQRYILFGLLLVPCVLGAAEVPVISFEITGGTGRQGDAIDSSVLISTDTDMQGWQLGVRYDGAVLSLADGRNGALLDTIKDGAPADFKELNLNPGGDTGVTQGVVVDLMQQVLLPPGAGYEVAVLTFNLDADPGDVELTTDVFFADDVGDPAITTAAVVEGLSLTPEKTDAVITIEPPPPDCEISLSCESDPDNIFLTFSYEGCDGPRPFEFLTLYRKRQDETEWTRLAFWDILDLAELPAGYDDLMLSPGIYSYVLSWVYWPASGDLITIGTAECTAEVVPLLISEVTPTAAFLPGVVRDELQQLVPGEIVITGRGFTTVEDTTLTIGGLPVEVTEVTPDTEIRGKIPCSSALGVFDLELTVAGRGDPILLEDAFTYGWLRGDVRIDGVLDIQDALDVLGYLFNIEGAVKPFCLDAADLNDDGFLDITDGIFMVYFLSGVDPVVYRPAEPFAEPDPAPGSLGCALDGYDCENPNP